MKPVSPSLERANLIWRILRSDFAGLFLPGAAAAAAAAAAGSIAPSLLRAFPCLSGI